MRRAAILSVAAATILMAAGPAEAEQGRGHIGLYSGVVLPQLGSELGTTIGVQLEGGYRVWKNLAPFLAVSYSQPTVDTTKTDPRITAGTYMTSTTQRELTVTLGAMWWFREPGEKWNIFLGLGARVWFLKTITNGSAGGMPFGENTEQSARFGGMGQVGAELTLGPGALGLTVEVGGSELPHVITGDVQTTALQIALGYRLFF